MIFIVFSSLTFLYFFLPLFLIIYFLTPMPGGSVRWRNAVILISSLFFYAWAEPVFIFILIVQCITSWSLALLINKYRGKTINKYILAFSISLDLGVLLLFKYADFFILNINTLFGTNILFFRLLLPIGISFYTFQLLSYTIDLYRGKIQVNRNLLDFATFVSMFPQLVAGPIVRYAEVEENLTRRKHRVEDVAAGLRRFTIGLGKKVLIADSLGVLVGHYRLTPENTVLFSWLYVTAFALKIYFDFSGYSDMAIGLGRVLGFTFPENFNYPYIAKSLKEFWQRWHMTLGLWFRDFVFIPLGGSRVKPLRYVFNVVFIWFLIGFWHGAAWNFIIWGLYFALVLLIEKYVLQKYLIKLPGFVERAWVLFSVLLTAVFFNAYDFADISITFLRLFGFGAEGFIGDISVYYLRSYFVLLLMGIVGSTPLPKIMANKIINKYKYVEIAGVMVVLLLSTAFLVDGSFQPFIYFRF